jgi:HlyD family secretion protein
MTVTIANSKSQLRLERRSLERPSEHAHSLKRHAWMGAAVIAVLVLGLGGWTATTQIAGAVVAGGTVVVDGGSKRVQHQEGGIVTKIFVKDDDKVAAGQLLVRLDDVAARTDLDVVLSQLRDAIGADSRLTAETTEAPSMVLPSIIGDWPSDPELAAVMGDQERLRQSRKKSLDSQASRLDEQIAAEQSQITGLKAQQDANKRQLALFQSENESLAKLFASSLVGIQQVNEMKRSQASLEGQMGGIAASIAAAESSVSGLQMQRAQLYVDFRSQAISDLQAASQSVAELLQKKVAAEARLNRLDIRAPIAGTVHESIVQTVGGVVNASDTLMLIVPQDNHLLVDTRISPLDIDKVHLGQPVQVRLSGLDVRATPELTGNVKAISPDLTRDPATGVQYYSVRLDIPDSEQKKLPSTAKLVPGMPAEAFIQTGDRTVLSYLMRPLTEQLSHTFREQ